MDRGAVSSTYSLICLSHDPAIEVYDITHGHRDEALAAALSHPEHPHCDIAVARYSGALVEVACLPGSPELPLRHRGHSGWHRDAEWVDAVWLKALILALDYAPEDARKAVGLPFAAHCWPPDRVNRLRPVLGLPKAPEAES